MGDSDSRLTHPSLLARLRDLGDADAWRQFVAVYAPLVYRWCRRQGLQEADAADVGQEVLAQVARSIRTFEYRPERGRFRDWLGAVVRSKLARFHHREARQVRADGADPALQEAVAPEADTAWTAAFHAHVLRVALERIRPEFPAGHWQAFELVWLQDRPPAEAAARLGLSPSHVSVIKWRVLQRLRDEIGLLAEDVPHLVPLGEPCDGR
jgi:RNA polymerase sigma-70 factor (ECF subfamily)